MADSGDIFQNLNVHGVQPQNPAPISNSTPPQPPLPDLPTPEPPPFWEILQILLGLSLNSFIFSTIIKLPFLLPSLGLCLR